MRRVEQRFTSGTSTPKVVGVPKRNEGESMGDYTNRLTQHRKDMLDRIDGSGFSMEDIFGEKRATIDEIQKVTTFDITRSDIMPITIKMDMGDFTRIFDYVLAQSQTGDVDAKRIFVAIATRMAALVTSSADPDQLAALIKYLQDDEE